MNEIEKVAQFLSKAEVVLGWSSTTLGEMREHGRHQRAEHVERLFFALLALFASAHEALKACAEARRLDDWLDRFENERKTDQLLLYLYKARNAHLHGPLIELRPSMAHAELKIVDVVKARAVMRGFYVTPPTETEQNWRLQLFLYGVTTQEEFWQAQKAGLKPRADRLQQAGVEIQEHFVTLSLIAFEARFEKGKVRTLNPPTDHLGRAMPPSADTAAQFAIEYYEMKRQELMKLCP